MTRALTLFLVALALLAAGLTIDASGPKAAVTPVNEDPGSGGLPAAGSRCDGYEGLILRDATGAVRWCGPETHIWWPWAP